MEKQVYELKIDPELRDLIPPLSEEEHRMLEDSIVRDGCDTPLIVWDGTIVDGHNRYEICRRHDIPFAYEERAFADKEAAMFWMLEHQLARRNLNSYQRSMLAVRFEPMLKSKAKLRLATSTGGHDPRPVQNSEQAEKGKTMDKLAKMAGVSRDTIAKVKKIDEKADEETKQQLRRGEKSIHRAYTDLVNKEHEGETRVCERCHEEKPYTEFTIPSNRNTPRSVCKDCEAKAKQAAKEAEQKAAQPAPRETGIQIKDGKTAHVALGLPDDPAMFDQVIDLFKHAQNAYLAAFESTLAQYQPSMISQEHSDTIRALIDYVADTTEDLLDQHLNSQKEDM